MTTGSAIRIARNKAGLTQKELADKLGIPYQSIGQWENDKRNPKFETLEKIAAALNTSVYVLLSPVVNDHYLRGFLLPALVAENLNIEVEDVVNALSSPDSVSKELRERVMATYWWLTGDSQFDPRLKDHFQTIIYYLDALNEAGIEKAIERLEELTEIPKYCRTVVKDAD